MKPTTSLSPSSATPKPSSSAYVGQNKQYIPARGEIIVFRYPKDPTKVFVKRVIGLPGDRIVIKNGSVTVFNKANPNGFNPDTKYEKSDTTTLIDTDEVVQAGNLFVMGDNRTPSGSYDSREWGELPSSYIIGHAVLRLAPPRPSPQNSGRI
jgi:signal peptidase I